MKKSFGYSVNLIKKYKWQSVFFSNFKKLFLGIAIPFLILCGLLYVYYSRAANTEIESSIVQNFSKTKLTIDNILTEVEKQYSILAYNTYVQAFINIPNVIRSGEISFSQLSETMNNFIISSNYMDSIYMYSILNDYVFSSRYGNYLNEFYDKDWYAIFSKTNRNFILPTKLVNNEYEILSIGYCLYSGTNISGVLVFNINIENLNELLVTDLNTDSDTIFLTDQDDMIIYSNEHSHILKNYQRYSQPISNIKVYDRYPVGIQKASSNIILFSSLDNHQLNLISSFNMFRFNQKLRNIRIILAACILISLLVPLMISLTMSINYYNSIIAIITSLNTHTDSDNIEVDKTNELSYIIKNISNIISKKSAFENELISKMAQTKKLQTMALQMQFNPHFLFNTLSIVNLIAMNNMGKKNAISDIIKLLSDLLSVSMHTNDYIVLLKDEISYAKKYLDILRIQYHGTFDVVWDINEAVLKYKTIKLILQPIIENAFEHGLKLLPPEKRGKIQIAIFETENSLVYNVINNGAGITDEKLDDIQNRLMLDDIPNAKHIGLCNINQRIKLIFGEFYGCKIYRRGQDVCTAITTPKTE